MPNHLAHFTIAADDVERARRFYERVFGWRIEAWGPPDFYIVSTDPDKTQGSIAKRSDLIAARREQPGTGRGGIGWECTLAVDDLDAIQKAIVKHGGKVVHEPFEIVGVGTLIRFEDTEGNIACAMRYVQ
jgi:predicted enzyme related to lactoylglutathione lyase